MHGVVGPPAGSVRCAWRWRGGGRSAAWAPPPGWPRTCAPAATTPRPRGSTSQLKCKVVSLQLCSLFKGEVQSTNSVNNDVHQGKS